MRRSIACWIITIVAAAAVSRGAGAGNPFDAAAIAPSDTRLLIHIEDAASIRKELADRPIGTWLRSLGGGQCAVAWSSLAKSAQLEEGRLFDTFLGAQFTLIARSDSEWSLITQVDPAESIKLLTKLQARMREPRDQMAISELPEQDMLIARDGSTLVIGPSKKSALFYSLLSRLATPPADSLATQPAMAKARELGTGRIALFCRHDLPMGGYSLVVADVRRDQLTIQHQAHFENAPFAHGITKLTCDCSPVKAFENNSLVAFVQPVDIGDGPLESFVSASLHEGLISPEMRKDVADRRITVVGEQDLRQADKPTDLLSTTFVSCLELKDPAGAIDRLDKQMIRLTKRVKDLGKGTLLIQIPNTRGMRPDQPRQVDVSAATDWFSGGFPIMKNVSLNWTVANGPAGSWFVIGSERRSLDDVVGALKKDCPRERKLVGQFDSCGLGNGIRIARHLRSWCDHADLFASPENAEAFRSSVRMISDLAAGIQSCCWQLARPTPNDMKLDIQIQLAPPESARGGS